VNRFPDHFADITRDDPCPLPAAIGDDFARLEPAAATPHLRERIALALSAEAAAQPIGPIVHGRRNRLRWLGERLAWACGGGLVAALLLGWPGWPRFDDGTDKPRLTSLPEISEPDQRQPATDRSAPAVVTTSTAATIDVAGSRSAARPVSVESLGFVDEGIHYLAEDFPARVYRHRLRERRLSETGTHVVATPRNQFIIVPMALR
jgi:hypothetical protein